MKQKILDLEKQIEEQNSKIMNMDHVIGEMSMKLNELEQKTIVEKPNGFVNNSEDEEIMINYKETIFKCDPFDFESLRNSGLNIHTGKVHKNIIQVDGYISMEEEKICVEEGVCVLKQSLLQRI